MKKEELLKKIKEEGEQAREAGRGDLSFVDPKGFEIADKLQNAYQAGQKDTLEKVVDEIERFRERLPVQIVGSLKSERDAHGEITIGGARKRIIHGLREPFNNLFSALKDITN